MRWILPPPLPLEEVEALSKKLNIMPLAAAILLQRGMSGDEASAFLDPSGKRFRDFRDLPGTEAAGELIAEAVRHGSKIAVFGDYDVDGITASALVSEFLALRGAEFMVRLPDRNAHGYGLNTQFIREAAAWGAKLLITVDCGITAVEEVDLARQLGIATLITDHHEPGPAQPAAEVIVNPKATGPADLHLLAGVGVAMQVIRAASHALGEGNPEILRRHLDLVALGTVADVVPLVGENRLLTRAGLAVINRGGRMGLKALIRAADLENEPVSSTHLAFRLAPRLNAAGRMGDARSSLDLLLCQDYDQAQELAGFLNQENSRRQSVEQTILREAEKQLSQRDLPMVIVISGPKWPLGVMGLVASKLCEKYHRPSFVLSEGEESARGSGRSIPGFPLHQALAKTAHLLEKWGGHEMAAGVTVPLQNRRAFEEALQTAAEEVLLEEHLLPALTIDAQSRLDELNFRLLKELRAFEPFGYGNTRPVFMVSRAGLAQPPRVLGERHLKLKLTDGRNHVMDAIGFGLGERAEELDAGAFLDVAGQISENNWNGTSTVQMELKDFRVW